MATISHLPHVLANVLVAAGREPRRRGDASGPPRSGRSFRDATRVAGANPADLGRHLQLQPRGGRRRDRRRGRAPARGGRAGPLRRPRGARRLARRGPRGPPPRCSRPTSPPRPLLELRVAVANRPGIVAEIALALGRAGVNIEDMALFPAADMRTGAISLWIGGRGEAERAAEIVSRPRPHVARSRPASRRRAGGRRQLRAGAAPCAGELTAPPDKSISHRAALLGGYRRGHDADLALPRLRGHAQLARRGRGARRRRGHGARRRRGARRRDRGRSACAAAPSPPARSTSATRAR